MSTFAETFGRGCGLNADWSCSAWRLAGSPTNTGRGLYALDNENGTFSIVWRDFECDDGGIKVLFTGTEAQAMMVAPEFARIVREGSVLELSGD